MSIAKPQIIDVHSHVLPPEYVSTLDQRGIKPVGGVSWPKWSPELGLEMMDKQRYRKDDPFPSQAFSLEMKPTLQSSYS